MRNDGVWPSLAVMIFAGALTGVPEARAQQDFDDVEIVATHVAGNVYMLTGRGGNIGVSAGPDGVLIVDDQFAPLADKIRVALAELTDDGVLDLKFVLNTHWHRDHVGGNAEFGPEAPIIAHSNVRKRVSTINETAFGVAQPLPEEGWPVVTFGDSLSIHFNGEEIRAIHFPHGHTDGDAVIFFTGSNVVHMGDDFFRDRFPFVDLMNGGSVEGLAANIELILDQLPPDVKIIPGHGAISERADVVDYLQMLGESIAVVVDGIEAGKSLEQIQAEGLPARWDGWGSGFISTDRWLALVYESVAGAE